ncbi:MAG: YqeG family HAD IIIA-type phosphatase [bacterium]|jgi:HAD superfamily phosphatase (TIGR01668 family)
MKKSRWLDLVSPDMYLDTVHDLPLDELAERGIKGLIFDLDNTLLHWNVCQVDNQIQSLLARLRERGFRSCLLSNNRKDRVEVVAQVMGLPAIPKAGKPRRRAFRQALDILQTKALETAVVGDQLFTDILGGNRLGLLTILVVPLSHHEFIGTRVVRCIERSVLNLLLRRKLIKKTPPDLS